MPTLTPFATTAELAAYWRTLTAEETTRSAVMLTLASNRLRVLATNESVDLDTKIIDDEAFKSTLQWVVMESVKRAIATPTDQPSVETWSQTAGPYSENYKYANSSGDIYFKKAELFALGIKGKQSLGSISTTKTDIYGESIV